MNENRVGVFVCHCGTNIAGPIDIPNILEFSNTLPGVVVTADSTYTCSETGQTMIQDTIKSHNLNRVVVAACSPSLHERTFRKAVKKAGLNPYMLQIANIREGASWIHDPSGAAFEKAKRVISAAVARVAHHEPLEEKHYPVNPDVLVIGAGIAGMEAALKAANSGKKVYLLEKEPSIGGHMSKFDKTFPTLDCAACILTPKMVEVSQNPNINLLTYSEIIDVSGLSNNGDTEQPVSGFAVKIKKKPRYINEETCTGCGDCEVKCPKKKIPSEYDLGLSNRKAVYRPFPQAVPAIPVIDAVNCTYFTRGTCRLCERDCPADAIDFDQQDVIMDLEVGAVVLATGFDLYDSNNVDEYRYGKNENIFTALEFERILNAGGPTGGKVLLKKNGEFTNESPKAVGIIHCVGSRDQYHKEYCSDVCCRYSLKFAHLIKEKTNADVISFYTDIRSFGKGGEEFYTRLQEEGVLFIRGRAAEVEIPQTNPGSNGKLIIRAEDSLLGKQVAVPVDMIVLSPALIPKTGTKQLSSLFHVGLSQNGFFMEKHVKLAPVATMTDGIYLAGTCQGPKDIPDSVAQGAAAASEAVGLINTGLVVEPTTSSINDEVCAACKTCIGLCPYSVITFDEEKNSAVIDEARCKGCGICTSVCPSGAVIQKFYSDNAILAEIIGGLIA